MRKILPLLVVVIIIFSGLGVVLISCEVTDAEIISVIPSNRAITQREIQISTQKLDDSYTFIVLTAAQFATALQPLISHKNTRSLSTKLVTLDEIYNGDIFPVKGQDDAEKIKYFIKNAIEQWGTSFVLLVGGSNAFPIRKASVQYNFVSDLYYSDVYNATGGFCSWDANGNKKFGEFKVDGVDIHPDVHLGRLPCVNESQVEICVNKIIRYEAAESYTKDWFRKLVVCGGDTLAPPLYPKNTMAEGEAINQAVINVMEGFIPEKIWASNGRLTITNPSGVDTINQAFNAGCGFVDMSGEGNTFGWATHPLNNSDTWIPTPDPGGYYKSNVPNLTNGEKLPVIVIGACKTHKFEEDPDCFGWTFLTNPNGGGIATIGTTTYAVDVYNESPNSFASKFELNLFKAYKPGGAITVGEMWSKALNSYIFSDMEKDDYLTLMEWVLFGDPSLAIDAMSQKPLKPQSPSGPESGTINTKYMYTSSASDPENDDLYYLFDWGDGTFSGWQGSFSSGEQVSVGHTWLSKGGYEIRVRVKDEHGMVSDWSDPLPVTMPFSYHMTLLQLLQQVFERFLHAFPILR
jgi:hypothetical protein